VPYLLIAGRTVCYFQIVLSGFVLFGVGFVKGRLAEDHRPVPARILCDCRGRCAFGISYRLVVQHFFPDISIPT
jgi:hypothetical protein